MRRLILLFCFAAALHAAPSVVQTTTCRALTAPNTVCTFGSNVTAGNLLVLMTGHSGGDECGGVAAATYSDTRGLTFSVQVDVENPSGNQSNSCIMTAPVTSSGAETITRNAPGSNYPVSMLVYEVQGIAAPLYVGNTGTADGGSSVTTGSAITASTSLLVCMSSDSHPSSLYDNSLPAGATVTYYSVEAAWLFKVVTPASYTCTFGKSISGGQRWTAALLLIYSGVPPGVPRRGTNFGE